MQINSYTHKRFCIWPCFCIGKPPSFVRQNTWLPLEFIKYCTLLKIYLVLGGTLDHQKTIQSERILNNNEKKKATTAAELLSDPYGEENNIKKKTRKIYKNIFHFPFMQVRISLLFSLSLKVKTFSTHL